MTIQMQILDRRQDGIFVPIGADRQDCPERKRKAPTGTQPLHFSTDQGPRGSTRACSRTDNRERVTLIIVEQDPLLAELFLEDLVFRAQVVDDGLLAVVDPAGEDGEKELPGLQDKVHGTIPEVEETKQSAESVVLIGMSSCRNSCRIPMKPEKSWHARVGTTKKSMGPRDPRGP
jgi:hypothetical protein